MRPIDADALFELFSSKYEEYGRLMEKQKVCSPISLTYGGMVEALFEALLDIRKAPTLDYAPVRHGEWIEGLKCSECGQIDMTRPNFCPNCGAKMDGGKKDG